MCLDNIVISYFMSSSHLLLCTNEGATQYGSSLLQEINATNTMHFKNVLENDV
jgi:hypothetical protein